jgi:hypothetical protein
VQFFIKNAQQIMQFLLKYALLTMQSHESSAQKHQNTEDFCSIILKKGRSEF